MVYGREAVINKPLCLSRKSPDIASMALRAGGTFSPGRTAAPRVAADGQGLPLYGGEFSGNPLGKIGEDLTADYLEELGYRILGRNYRTSFGEIDIVCADAMK